MSIQQSTIETLVAIYYKKAQEKYGVALTAPQPSVSVKGKQAGSTSLKQTAIYLGDSLETAEEVENAIRHEVAHYVLGMMTGEGCHRDMKGKFLPPEKVHTAEWNGLVEYLAKPEQPKATEMLAEEPADEAPESPTQAVDAEVDEGPTMTFYVKTRGGVYAVGHKTAKGFMVYKGSTIVANPVPTFPKGYNAKREKLLANGVIDPETMVITTDYEFSSASCASSIVTGRATAGTTTWKNGDGKTMKELGLG